MATPLPPPLFGSTPSALPNGTIPALAAGDFLTIERKTDGKVFNALVSQFDTRYTAIAQGVLAAEIGDTVQAHSANLDAWAAVVPASYLTIAAGNAAYQPLNAYLSQFAGLTPGPATDGYVVAWDDGAEAYALVAQSGGGASLPVVDETALVFKTGSPAITATFDANSLTQARVYGLPDASTTLAGLAVANVFTADQQVEKATGAAILAVKSGSQFISLWSNSNASFPPVIGYGPSVDLRFGTATSTALAGFSEKARLTSAGELVIGTTTAIGGVNKLLVFGTSSTFQSGGNLTVDYRRGATVNSLLTNMSTGATVNWSAGMGISTSNFGWYEDGSIAAPRFEITKSSDLTTFYGRATAANNIVDLLSVTRSRTGSPDTGFGAAVRLGLKSSTTEDQDAARIAALWDVATHASRSADLVAYASDFGGEREIWRGRATGAAPAIAFLGATPVVRAAHIADPAGGGTVDAEARAAINSIIDTLEAFGFNATS